jgi:hypothetical protein
VRVGALLDQRAIRVRPSARTTSTAAIKDGTQPPYASAGARDQANGQERYSRGPPLPVSEITLLRPTPYPQMLLVGADSPGLVRAAMADLHNSCKSEAPASQAVQRTGRTRYS